ncbi:MAG: outer membrane protein transport protein [Polyangiaceae bacterium]|nr:outer membrane protein transport protein [Polyangiaceae bacterium]
MIRRTRLAWALGVAAALATAPAGGTLEEAVGASPRSAALGGSAAARELDFSGAYYNPATLAPGGAARAFELSLGLAAIRPALWVRRSDGTAPTVTGPARDVTGLWLGSRFELARPAPGQRLSAGLSLWVPGELFYWNIVPDDDLVWTQWNDRLSRIGLRGGLAYRLSDALAFGAGLGVYFAAATYTRGEVTAVRSGVDPVTGKSMVIVDTRIGTDSTVYGRATPSAGLLFTPTDTLRLGVAYRHRAHVDDWGDTRIGGAPGLGNLGYSHHYAHYFEPSSVQGGVALRLGAATEASLDTTWARWSEALSTNRDDWGPGRWGDTLTLAAGASHRVSAAIGLAAGYRYVPSPVGNFGGPTNFLDNDRHVFSLGGEVALSRPVRAESARASFVWALGWATLVPRAETKDFRRFTSDDALAANPGASGYRYGGQIGWATAGLEARW